MLVKDPAFSEKPMVGDSELHHLHHLEVDIGQ